MATKEHILLVEDEDGLQVMIGKMLRLYGYRVTTAGSGTEGIKVFSANPDAYQMITTDVVMPDMSGTRS
jgi:CheY-like chemotaxis protein